MGIILPLIYLVAGLTLALTLPEHRGRRLKEWASALLTRWIIPAVIIYTVATSRPELFFVAASTMVMMLLGVLGAGRITRDPVQKLAFVYLNAGLFGIPVVAGIWGDEAVRVYIGAYIGNSIMGNILGTSLLRGDSRAESGEGSPPRTATAASRGATIRRVLRGLRTSPPVIAVVIGLLCLPVGPERSRGRVLPGAHLGLQLYRDDRAGHVARGRQAAPRRPDPGRRMGGAPHRARERLQPRRAGARPLGARRGGRTLRPATGLPAGALHPGSPAACRQYRDP